jgi:hypothetical protein
MSAICIDLRLPDNEIEEAELLAAAEQLPDPLAIFALNWLRKQVVVEHRNDDDWRA